MFKFIKSQAKNAIHCVFSHRFLYAGLFVSYVMACLHINELVVYGSAAVFYFALALRG